MLCDGATEDFEAGRLKPEAHAHVELQSALVLHLRVDHGFRDPAAAEPVEGVGDEGTSEPPSLHRRLDGKPLQVPASPGPARHRVPDDLAVDDGDPEATRRRSRHRLGEAALVEPPESGESLVIGGEGGGPVAAPPAAKGGIAPG